MAARISQRNEIQVQLATRYVRKWGKFYSGYVLAYKNFFFLKYLQTPASHILIYL